MTNFHTKNSRTFHKNPTNVSVDRIDSAQGYIRGNVQLVCASYNFAKSDMSPGAFLRMCTDVHLYALHKNNNESIQIDK